MIAKVALFALVVFGAGASDLLSAQTPSTPLRGVVLTNEGGAPVAGASVRVTPLGRTTRTDLSGLFTIDNLSPGQYTLITVASAYRPDTTEVVVPQNVPMVIRLSLESVTLSDLVVEGTQNEYRGRPSSFGGKVDIPVLDLPVSVNGVSRALLDDRQAIDVKEVLRLVSGVSAGRSATTEMVIRGFNDNGGTTNFGAYGGIYQINGLRNYLTDYVSDVQLVNVERVEVLKGATGALYGFNQPGGVVNLVTKAPLATPRYEFSIAGGTWGRYRATLDATGPLGAGDDIRYRFNAGMISSPDYRGSHFQRAVTVAPSVFLRTGTRSDLIIDGLFTTTTRPAWFDWGVPTRDAAGQDIFDDVSLDYTPHPQGDATTLRSYGAIARFRHELSPAVQLHLAATVSGNSVDHAGHYPDFAAPDDNGDVPLIYRTFGGANAGAFSSSYLTADLRMGGVRHQIVAGLDYFRGTGEGVERSAANSGALPDNVPPMNVYRPGETMFRTPQRYQFDGGYNYFEQIGYTAAYVQDIVHLSPRLRVMGGLRVEDHGTVSGLGADRIVNRPLLPNLGLVVRPKESLALYASYTQGFQPQLTQDPGLGGPFDPLYSRQLEAGIKQEALQGRLLATASIYQIRRVNQLVSAEDPSDPDLLRQEGETKSEGIEFDVAGNIGRGWSVAGNVATNFARATISDNPDAIGRRLPNAPRRLAALWLRHEVAAGPLAGLSIAAGASHVGERLGGFSFTRYDGYTLLDAALSYRLDRLTLSLNMNNLTNVSYLSGIWSDFYAQRGLPRNLMLRMSVVR